MRIVLSLAVFTMLASAFALYAVNYETRKLAEDVRQKEQELETARRDIAILKAERAHLSRPERIGKHARALGLKPAQRSQFVAFSDPDPLARKPGR
jgi:cell division protein FtsL